MKRNNEGRTGDEHLKNDKISLTDASAAVAAFGCTMFSAVMVPLMYSRTGMPFAGVYTVTIVSIMLTTIAASIVARTPLIIAPAVGLNAYIAYLVVISRGMMWGDALGIVLVSAAIFIAMMMSSLREKLLKSLPQSIRAGLMAGLGILIAVYGLIEGHLIMMSPMTLVTLGSFADPMAYLSALGIALTLVLIVRRVHGALVIGMAVTMVLSLLEGSFAFPAAPFMLPERFDEVMLHVSFGFIADALTQGDMGAISEYLTTLLTVFLVMSFESMGVIEAIKNFSHGNTCNDESDASIDAEKSLKASAGAGIVGSLFGAGAFVPSWGSLVASEVGGRRSRIAEIVALLFLALLFCAPTAQAIAEMPAIVAAPLVVTGAMIFMNGASFALSPSLMKHGNLTESLPAFITMVAIPFTFSLSDGLGIGIIMFVILKLAAGKRSDLTPLTMIFAALWLIHWLF